jgi:hypothetical protein
MTQDRDKTATESGTKGTLTVIEGGKSEAKGKKSGKQAGTNGGLTVKQARFAELLAEGLTNAEAYRQAYDASEMKAATVHNESAKLAQHPGVAARVNDLLTQKRAKHGMLSEKQSDRVWRNVWRLAEGDQVPPSVQQAALALAAKMAGMLTDKVEIDQKVTDSKSIEAELLQRLQRLTG